jgi:hypothetical protein
MEGSAHHKSLSLDRLKTQDSSNNGISSLEPDPQERPPSWVDFGVAIFYIIFGCIALTAGLYSLFAIPTTDKPVPAMAIAKTSIPLFINQ